MYNPKNMEPNQVIHMGLFQDRKVTYQLKDFLQSADSDWVEISHVLARNFKRLAVEHREVENYILEIEGYEIRIAHCYRSQNTYDRLEWIYLERVAAGKYASKPSKTSQHFFGEAVDCHLYHNGVRIRGVEECEYITKLISTHFPGKFLQIFAYRWGIHLSIETSRSLAAGIKSKFGVFR